MTRTPPNERQKEDALMLMRFAGWLTGRLGVKFTAKQAETAIEEFFEELRHDKRQEN